MLKITYNDKNYFIGDLDKKIKIEHDLDDDKKLRHIEEVRVDITELIIALKLDSNKIESVGIKVDPTVKFKDGDELIDETLEEYLVTKNLPAITLTV